MSRYTWERIPTALAHSFGIYQAASRNLKPIVDPVAATHLRTASDEYAFFNRLKLLHHDNNHTSDRYLLNRKDFTPLYADAIGPLFDQPLRPSLSDDPSVHEIMKIAGLPPASPDPQEPLISERSRSAKKYTPHEAKILQTFAAACSPELAVPPTSSAYKTFKWLRKLLSTTPIIIFLRQKQSLFSDDNIRQFNFSVEKLRDAIDDMTARYVHADSVDQRIRNYHFTDLVATDLFKLASILVNSDVDSSRVSDPAYWRSFPLAPDPLYDALLERQMPRLVSTNDSGEEDPLLYLIKRFSSNFTGVANVTNFYPFNVFYSNLYIITVEELVVNDDHSQLLDLLEGQEDMEIVAARLDLSRPAMSHSVSEGLLQTPDALKGLNLDYHQLLALAKKLHTNTSSRNNIASFLERLAYMGLVKVEDGSGPHVFNILRDT